MHGDTGRYARLRYGEQQRAYLTKKKSNLWEHTSDVHDRVILLPAVLNSGLVAQSSPTKKTVQQEYLLMSFVLKQTYRNISILVNYPKVKKVITKGDQTIKKNQQPNNFDK